MFFGHIKGTPASGPRKKILKLTLHILEFEMKSKKR